ncbi:MAG: EamA family transporter [Candidatus Paceibacterota bacterium]
MEIWALYAIGASFLWSLVNISDQYLVSRYSTGRHTSGALVLFSSLIGIVIALPMLFLVDGLWSIPLHDIALLFIAGAMSALWIILYLYSMEIEDVSVVVPWFLTVPVFGYILGFLFLGEELSFLQQVGSLVVLLGLAILSFDFSKAAKTKLKTEVMLYMFCACVLIALQGIIFKHVTVIESFWISSFWEYVGLGLAGVFLYVCVPQYRREFMTMLRHGGKQIFTLNMTSEIVSVAGNLLSTFALLLAPVTIVYLLTSFQPAFVLLFSVLGTLFIPNIIKEDISLRVLVPKIFAIAIMIAGSVFLF